MTAVRCTLYGRFYAYIIRHTKRMKQYKTIFCAYTLYITHISFGCTWFVEFSCEQLEYSYTRIANGFPVRQRSILWNRNIPFTNHTYCSVWCVVKLAYSYCCCCLPMPWLLLLLLLLFLIINSHRVNSMKNQMFDDFIWCYLKTKINVQINIHSKYYIG